jgi:hypothetical protein
VVCGGTSEGCSIVVFLENAALILEAWPEGLPRLSAAFLGTSSDCSLPVGAWEKEV